MPKNSKRYNDSQSKNNQDEVIKIVDSSVLKRLYEKMEQMSDAERQARIEKLEEEFKQLSYDFFDMSVDGNISVEDGGDKKRELLQKGTKIRKDKKKIENFVKVREKLEIIAKIKADLEEQKKEKIAELQKEIEKAQKQIEETEKKIEELEERISDTKSALGLVKSQKAKDAIEAEIEELQAERDGLEIEELQETLAIAEEDLETYTSRKE